MYFCCEFYNTHPPTHILLNHSITFARSVTTISDSIINIIHQSRKFSFFDKTFAWVKKGDNYLFDVTMGSYDGAEICELIGLYLLNWLSIAVDKTSVGLYRDDGLAAINNTNGPMLDRIRKDIIALFKEEGLSITIKTNLFETFFRCYLQPCGEDVLSFLKS